MINKPFLCTSSSFFDDLIIDYYALSDEIQWFYFYVNNKIRVYWSATKINIQDIFIILNIITI